jgi:hypothetical protein
MRFTTLKAEKSVNALVTRLYGELPEDQRATAKRALLRANPQLETFRDVPAGAVLVVPDAPAAGAGGPPADAPNDSSPGADYVREVIAALGEFRRTLRVAARADAEDAAQTAPTLKSKGVATLLRAAPELQEHADRVLKAAKQRTTAAKSLEEFADSGLEELENDLTELAARLA